MDTAERREHRRNELIMMKRTTLNSERHSSRPHFNAGKHGNSSISMHSNTLGDTHRGFFGAEDENTHGGGNWLSEDGQFTDEMGSNMLDADDDFSSSN
jgi:hypothetical protein